MLFPTIEFAVFFAVVFPITWLLNDKNALKKWFLVAASYFFYGFWSIGYLLILFGSSVANFLLALWLARLPDGAARRAALWLGIIANLAVLATFKYYNFFVASVTDAMTSLGLRVAIPFLEV